MADMKNPAVEGGASRDMLGGSSLYFFTLTHQREQWLLSRFYLSPWVAREVSSPYFGERAHD